MTGPFFPSVDPATLRLRDQHLPDRLSPANLVETIQDAVGSMAVGTSPATVVYNDTLGTLTVALDMVAYAAITIPPVTLTDGGTVTLNAALGRVFKLTAAGNRTIAVPTNAVDGREIVIAHTASGGARTLSLTSGAGGFAFGTDITALSATSSGLTDYIRCLFDATANRWRVISYVKGFA